MKASSLVTTIAMAALMVLAALLVLVADAADAQDRPLQQDAPRARQNCAAAAPQAQPPVQNRKAPNGENLSEQLSKSGGVICPPPAPDPGIALPPPGGPNGGKTPVIPPPGTPGGDPNVRPK